MAFNISRQPLIPAFLVLTALAVATVCGIGASRDVFRTADASAQTIIQGDDSAGTGAQIGAAAADYASELQFGMPDSWLAEFQTAFPGWAAIIAGIVIVFAGMVLGRMAIRYNLHAVNTCISMSLFGIVACGLPAGGNYLTAFAAAALLALVVKNYAHSFCNGYGFDGIFRATCYQGILLLLYPATAPLLLLLPLAALLFQRTLREAVVGLFGLSLPLLLLCYVNWGAGGSFAAPIQHLVGELTSGTFFGLFGQISIPTLLMLGIVVLLDLFAVMLFLADVYNVGTKPRFILVFNIGVLLLTAVVLLSPAATRGAFALLAVPSAMLLPVLFVRIHRWIALAIYLLLLAGAFWSAAIQ